jgi:hypothetical protein
MSSVLIYSRTYCEATGLVRALTADGREVLLRQVRGGFENLTDGGRVREDDLDWDRREVPVDLKRVRVLETF